LKQILNIIGGYGRLQLGDVYTCHGFFPRTSKFEIADFGTIFNKLIEGFGSPWDFLLTKFVEPSRRFYVIIGK
jgi:hypothetical protein